MYDATTTMLHRWDDDTVLFPPQWLWPWELKFIRQDNLVSHSPLGAFFWRMLTHVFNEERLPAAHSVMNLRPVTFCSNCCPSTEITLPISTRSLNSTKIDHQVGHLFYQAPSPSIAQYVWATSSRKSLDYSKPLSFKEYGGPLCSCEPPMQQNLCLAFPRSVPRHNLDAELCLVRFVPFQIISS